jgi:malate dehydrogenase (oxaloacetate-decarboxylating)
MTGAKGPRVVRGPDRIVTSKRGFWLLKNPSTNKDLGFTQKERDRLGLNALLPPQICSIEEQVELEMEHLQAKTEPLEKYIGLSALQDRNEVLFYRVLVEHLAELMPIVYTPTVGQACQSYSHIHRNVRGIWLTPDDINVIPERLREYPFQDIRLIVATDNERILGLGDQGAGGMGIPIGKLSLYTAAGGIDPARTLPVMIDVGTNNESLLSDPLYLGWRHRRVEGDDYDSLVDAFVRELRARRPNVLLQWEDFAQHHATRLLERHRQTLCSFNDDIQGTAAVTIAAILAGLQATATPVTELRLVIVGAGSAGTGIARQAVRAMVRAGLSEHEAIGRCWLVDRDGLLHDGMENLLDIQRDFARAATQVGAIPLDPDGRIDLVEVCRHVAPHAIVGVSGQPGLFSEVALHTMAELVEHPIVLPLSNPTPRAEAQPSDVVAWTDGRAMVGTGSPFAPVRFGSRTIEVSQVNNVHVFPGVGLGVLAAQATTVTDNMLTVAADAVSELSPAAELGPTAPLLPSVADSRHISRRVAAAVARAAIADGVAAATDRIDERLDELSWEPVYRDFTA